MQRRELFGFLSTSISNAVKGEQQKLLIRPPYYNEISAFGIECHKCDGKCASLCQEQIIVISDDKTPILDLSTKGCTYCDECAQGCPEGVLQIEYKKNIDVLVEINKSKCLSWQGVMCFACKDPCLENAIDFQAMFMPEINTQCTSCGFCIGKCPTNAIELKGK